MVLRFVVHTISGLDHNYDAADAGDHNRRHNYYGGGERLKGRRE